DQALAALGRRWQDFLALPLGATGRALPSHGAATQAPGSVRVAVVGAHLTGMPLNFQLTSPDAVPAEPTTTAASYRPHPPPGPAPPAAGSVRVAVVGAHLAGMPLNFQLTSRDAVLVEQTTTAASYRLYALPGTVPPKPGLARVEADGSEIIVELWDVPQARFGEFVAEIPAPLGIGNLQLADGRWVKGFICEPYALEGARDI